MKIRKIWLLALAATAGVSVGINVFVLGSLTERYFSDYLSESYKEHTEQIADYTRQALLSDEISYSQMSIELETHLDDPITRIKVYSPEGELLVDVKDDYHLDMGVGSHMMDRMMEKFQEKVDSYDIKQGDEIVGIVNVTKYSSEENTIVAARFKSSLFRNSLLSAAISGCASLALGLAISRKMSIELKDTEELAESIQLGEFGSAKKSYIDEVDSIRRILAELGIRLKLRQKSRKELIDQLVHQARTPLTVLRSHLEAIEDGVVRPDEEEIRICQNQIENLTAIISNISRMIDASKETAEVEVEEFEVGDMLRQIVTGLRAQFEKKSISLELESSDQILARTDKYKVSQAIYNIMTNAYKYTEPEGKVTVSYSTGEGMFKVEIEDTGIGIESGDLEKVFEPYYRSGVVQGMGGEGIGLHIARENLNLVGGSIWVESKFGEGSKFTVSVPLEIGFGGDRYDEKTIREI